MKNESNNIYGIEKKVGGIWVSYQIIERLEYLRKEIQAERISYGEIIELCNLKKYIDKNDIELLQWTI